MGAEANTLVVERGPKLSDGLKAENQAKLEALVAELEARKTRLEREISARTRLESETNTRPIPQIPLEPATRALDILSVNYLSKRLGLGTEHECKAFLKELVEKTAVDQWMRIKPGPLADFFMSNNLVDHKLNDGLWIKMW